jgi:putative transcriptional regulator
MNKFFNDLMESVQEMDEIVKGARAPARETYIDDVGVRKIRLATGLSQSKFAKLIDVPVDTVQNWEQGRRAVKGPALALMRALKADPERVVRAIRTA